MRRAVKGAVPVCRLHGDDAVGHCFEFLDGSVVLLLMDKGIRTIEIVGLFNVSPLELIFIVGHSSLSFFSSFSSVTE